MDMENDKRGTIGRLVFVAIASTLFASTMILSAVGPAKATEAVTAICDEGPLTVHYLA